MLAMAPTEAASLGYAISVGECNIGIRNNNAAFASQIVSLWDYSTPVMIVSKGPHWESSHNLWTTSIWRAMWSKPLSLNPIKHWGTLLLREGVGLSDAGERCVWIGSKYKYQVQRLLRNDPRNVNMSSRCPNGLQFPEIPILLSFHETYWNKSDPPEAWTQDDSLRMSCRVRHQSIFSESFESNMLQGVTSTDPTYSDI